MEATVAEEVELFQENVEFTTEAGFFIEAGADSQTITKQIQSRATQVILQTPTKEVENVLIQAKVGAYVAQINLDFLPEDLNTIDFFDLEVVPPATILADNISEAQITVTLNERFEPDSPLVLTTDQGKFSNTFGQPEGATITLNDLSQDVIAFVVADVLPNPAVRITASHQGFSETIQLTFLPAPPLTGSLTRSKAQVQSNGTDQATLTANFLRSGTSLVSDNQLVVFEASPIDTSLAVAQFTQPFVNTANQSATSMIFSANNLSGDVEVSVYLLDSEYTDTLKTIIQFIE